MKKMLIIMFALLIVLISILIVSCDWQQENDQPTEKEPKMISDELFQKMKEDFLIYGSLLDETPDDVILEYYGGEFQNYYYNDHYYTYVVVMLDASKHTPEVKTEKISSSGVNITYQDTNRIVVWNSCTGSFLSLGRAHTVGIITSEDVQKIADDFHSKINDYTDICDVYDFEQRIQYGHIPDLFEEKFAEDRVKVKLSKELSKMKDLPLLEFFGEDIFEGIIDEDMDGDKKFLTLSLKDKSKKGVIYALERLRALPGVFGVECIDLNGWDAVSQDPMVYTQWRWIVFKLNVHGSFPQA